MKKLFLFVLVLAAITARAQNIRWDLGAPGSAGVVTSAAGGYLVAIGSVDLNWCNYPANAVPCTNFANTYPTISSSSPCSTSAQIVLQGSTTCVATSDSFGNLGVWTLPGTYAFTLTANGVTYGPFAVTIGNTSNVGGGGNPILENCTPDQTGNSFPQVLSLTNWFYSHWEFIFNTTTYINCTIYIPTGATGATFVVDVASADNTAGHTANIQTCDQVINTGTLNIGALTCAANQVFTTTATAYNRVTLTFNVQSTLSNGSILVVKIGTSPTGTAPTSDLLIYPHFIL